MHGHVVCSRLLLSTSFVKCQTRSFILNVAQVHFARTFIELFGGRWQINISNNNVGDDAKTSSREGEQRNFIKIRRGPTEALLSHGEHNVSRLTTREHTEMWTRVPLPHTLLPPSQ
jgi:hypothetical protein